MSAVEPTPIIPERKVSDVIVGVTATGAGVGAVTGIVTLCVAVVPSFPEQLIVTVRGEVSGPTTFEPESGADAGP
jgi:hypothetical protein